METNEAVQAIEAIRSRQPKRVEPTPIANCLPQARQAFRSSVSVEPEPTFEEQARRWREQCDLVWASTGIDQRAREAAMELVDDGSCPGWWKLYEELGTALGTGMLFAIVGTYGSGKTVLAARLMRDAIGENFQPRPKYTTAPKIFRDLQRAFNDGPPEQQIINSYISPCLLVIDEAHERAHSDYEDRRLREIIDCRYGRKQDTILMTNMEPAAFAKTIGNAAVDRMRQCGGFRECTWPSFRGAA